MSKHTDNSLFIVSSMSGLYQVLRSGIDTHKELGNRIISAIKAAHAFRQVEKVAELSEILVNNPIKEYQLIGQYYLAWSKYRGNENQPQILEKVIEQSRAYKTKALISRAALEVYKGNHEHALHFYAESFKANPTVSDYIAASNGIAILKSIEGFSQSALKDLETLLPLLRHAEPLASADVLNSYAVELGEAGRKYEAHNVIRHVIASPFAIAYPEWQDTAKELKGPDRAFISIPESLPKIERKHVELETKSVPTPKKDRNPADVLPFRKLEEAPEPEKPERVSPIDLDDMTEGEKLDFIMTALRTGAIRPTRYNDMIYQGGMLKTGPASRVLDLEDESVMTDKLIEWAHLIDPDDLAGVLSLLRDCDDRIRRVNLIDAMIRKLFEYSAACGVSEEAWRKKVERRLPKQ